MRSRSSPREATSLSPTSSMRCSSANRALAALLALVIGASPMLGQSTADRVAMLSWIDLDVAPGRERDATDAIRASNASWRVGPLGSLLMTHGTGSPRRVIACALDAPGYV